MGVSHRTDGEVDQDPPDPSLPVDHITTKNLDRLPPPGIRL